MDFNLIKIPAGTRLFHGSKIFSQTQLESPSKRPIIFFSTQQKVAELYGTMSHFVVVNDGFLAAKLNDPLNIQCWSRSLPDHDAKLLRSTFIATPEDQVAPRLRIYQGIPTRISKSNIDQNLFSILMDVAGVDAIYVSVETSMRHPEIAVRYKQGITPIERTLPETIVFREAFLIVAGICEHQTAPLEVAASDLSAYVKWLWQWSSALNLDDADKRLCLIFPLGVSGKKSLFDYQLPPYSKLMSSIGLTDLDYLSADKRIRTFLWDVSQGGKIEDRCCGALFLATRPHIALNRDPAFVAFVTRESLLQVKFAGALTHAVKHQILTQSRPLPN